MQHAAARLLDMGACSNVVNSLSLLANWRSYVKPTKAQAVRTATNQALPVQGFIFLQVCKRDLLLQAWFCIEGNLVMDLKLWTSYIFQCICGILPAEQKVVPMHSCPVAILTSLLKVMLFFKENVRHDAIAYGLRNLGYFSYHVAHPAKIQPYTKLSIMVAIPAAWIS